MIRRLNHAVLWVRDAQRSAEFYTTVLGFEAVATMGSQAVFLRADGSTNDHDLGLFSVGDRPQPPPQSPGLYHLAWQVNTIEDLAASARQAASPPDRWSARATTASARACTPHDPDGIEFEVMWAVPKENWPIRPDDRTARPRCRARSMGSGRHRRSVDRCHGRSSTARSAASNVSDGGTRSRCAATPSATPAGSTAAAIRRARRRAGASGRTPVPAARRAGATPWRACSVNSVLVTGSGAVRLTGPQISADNRWAIAPTSSSIEIQLCHWWPLPNRPPSPSLEQRQLLLQRATLALTARRPCGGGPFGRPPSRRASVAASHC